MKQYDFIMAEGNYTACISSNNGHMVPTVVDLKISKLYTSFSYTA